MDVKYVSEWAYRFCTSKREIHLVDKMEFVLG